MTAYDFPGLVIKDLTASFLVSYLVPSADNWLPRRGPRREYHMEKSWGFLPGASINLPLGQLATQWSFCGLNVCVFPKPHVKNLMPKAMVLVCGDFGVRLGHKGGARTCGMSTFVKRPHRVPLPFLSCEGAGQDALWAVSPHQPPNMLASWSWTSKPPELWKINVCHL